MKKIYESCSREETMAIGQALGASAQPGDIFCVTGELGAGKTVLAKGFAIGLAVEENITSPTFTIVNEYEGRLPFYHFDLYRIVAPAEMENTGYEEYFYGDGVCLVEWAELAKEYIPPSAVWITMEKTGAELNYRRIVVEENEDTCH